MTATYRPCYHPPSKIARNQVDDYNVLHDICRGCGEAWIYGNVTDEQLTVIRLTDVVRAARGPQ